MADQLKDLLSRRQFEEPPEVQIIKEFIDRKYHQPAAVTVQPNQIIIQVKGAALAGALRTHLYELAKLCQTDKRLVLRIS